MGGGESVGKKLGAELEGRIRGEEQGGKFLNSPERPEQGELSSFIHLLLKPPTVWALDLPRMHPVKVTMGLMCIKQPMHL
jgi:hypothetical protein